MLMTVTLNSTVKGHFEQLMFIQLFKLFAAHVHTLTHNKT